MIARYSRPPMADIWSDRNRYRLWLKVEMAVCRHIAEQGGIPPSDWAKLKARVGQLEKRGGIDPREVERHEAKTRHDVIAFTTALADQIGPVSRYIHYGLTSSDVVDSALSLQIGEAGEVLLKSYKVLLGTLKTLARKYQGLPTIGRSHGIFAEPTSFGLKFLGWFSEGQRNYTRLQEAFEGLRVGKISGAVGVNPHFGPQFEKKVLGSLGLRREPVSTQVIPRDRHAHLLNVFALCGGALERIAVELRHLQRSEVAEVMEGFKKGQKGSSAMPHKRNPISTENLTGCARLLRSYASAALENIALWHERDISHSAVERIVFPDSMILLDYALDRMNSVLEGLVIRRDRVLHNLSLAGSTVFSGHYLLALVKNGATREDAYGWVQECALASLEGRGNFIDLLKAHTEVSRILTVKEIGRLGSIEYQLRNVSEIFRRVSEAR